MISSLKGILAVGLYILLTVTVSSQNIVKIGGVDDPVRVGGVTIDSIKSVQSVNVVPPLPQIGDYRYGGVVFYIDDTGKHGLVCAIEDLPNATWGCAGTEISGADGRAIGTGYQNTQDILAGCTELSAARRCHLSKLNGYHDWFLPSIDELHAMYLNKDVIDVTAVAHGGSTFGGRYWSSTEYHISPGTYVWEQTFEADAPPPNRFQKYLSAFIRAVRAF